MAATLYLSDDRDELAAMRDETAARRGAALAEMLAADTGDRADWPAFDAASAAFDRADRELGLIERRLDELDDDAGWDELREMRSDYYRGCL